MSTDTASESISARRMDVSRAQVMNLGDEVLITDPDFPHTVRVCMREDAPRPEVEVLTVVARAGAPITSTVLTQIPMRQIAGVAASALLGQEEAQYRMLAAPRPTGSRSWPPEHFRNVRRVAQWATATGRPGGAIAAVADFWDVNPRTARRWIAHRR